MIRPGTVLFDQNFRFKDGSYGQKLFVVLNEGSAGKIVGVKTTSQGGRYSNTYGCSIGIRYPSFYLPEKAACLNSDTWIQLEDFFLFDTQPLVDQIGSGRIHRIGLLTNQIAMELIDCASRSDDIDGEDAELILSDCKCLSTPHNISSGQKASTSL